MSLASFQLADVGGVEPTDALERFLYDRRHLIAGDVYYIIQRPYIYGGIVDPALKFHERLSGLQCIYLLVDPAQTFIDNVPALAKRGVALNVIAYISLHVL